MQKIIVDGYNVIHADEDLKAIATASGMERAREALLSRLKDYVAAKRVKLTVVFDGAGGLVDSEALVPSRLQVLYSATGQSADEVIVSVLHNHSNPREYIVVTSDMADIGRAVRAVGATVMASAAFLSRLGVGGTPPARGRGEKPDPDKADVDFWLEEFRRSNDGKSGTRDD